MKEHVNSSRVQEEGCRALHCLALPAGGKDFMMDTGATEAVVLAMRSHEDAEGVQEEGCRVLRLLASRGAKMEVYTSVLPAVVDGMSAHRHAEGVQACGCGVLCKLTDNAETIKEITDFDRIRKRWIVRTPTAREVLESAKTWFPDHKYIQDRCTKALGRLPQFYF